MKQIVVVTSLLLIVAFSADSAQPYTSSLGGRLWQIKELVASQIERVKMAREEAENHMTLARLRVAEQLRISEERLAMQLEKLQEYEEILKEQLDESGAAITAARADWDSLVDSVASELQTQIAATNKLIEELRRIRGHVNDGSNTVNSMFPPSLVPQSPTPSQDCPQDPIRNLQSLLDLQAELDGISTSISPSQPSVPVVSLPPPPISTGG
jgi:DNA anti-recombination protein RmuC